MLCQAKMTIGECCDWDSMSLIKKDLESGKTPDDLWEGNEDTPYLEGEGLGNEAVIPDYPSFIAYCEWLRN